MNKQYRLGIDLGGTGIKVGLVNTAHEIVAIHSVPTQAERPYQEVLKDMAEACREVLRQAGVTLEEVASLGIGSPGCIDAANGVVAFAANLNWEMVPVLDTLRTYFDLPMAISNDANCATLGEVVAGAAKDCASAVMLTLGTGLGGGVVLDHKIVEGGHAGGMELGHMIMVRDGEPCTCGRKGCYEAYCSATALIRDTRRAAEAHPESSLNAYCGGDLSQLNGLAPFACAQSGDAVAQAVVDNYIRNLSECITDFINIFRPDIVLLGGGICAQGAYLTDPINAFVKQCCFAGNRAFIPPVTRATLGNDAGIIGAAALV